MLYEVITNTILTLFLGKDFCVIVQVLQILALALHSEHSPVLTQGVFISRRIALEGAT